MRGKWRLLVGLLAGTGLLSVPLSWLFRDYVPTFLFDRALGFVAAGIASHTGIPETRVIAAAQNVAFPIILAGMIALAIFRFSMWHHARQVAATQLSVDQAASPRRFEQSTESPLVRALKDSQYEQAREMFKSAPVYDTPIARLVAHVSNEIGEAAGTELFPATRRAIRQAALDGRIKLRGRKQIDVPGKTEFSEVYTEIPAEYWKASVLNVLATDERHQPEYHTDPESVWAWGKRGIHEPNRYASILGNLFEFQRARWK
jgi:hypothetical protein